MRERQRCMGLYDEQTHIHCDLWEGHDGPCDTTLARRALIDQRKAELREAEHALYAARGETPPRNRRERRARR